MKRFLATIVILVATYCSYGQRCGHDFLYTKIIRNSDFIEERIRGIDEYMSANSVSIDSVFATTNGKYDIVFFEQYRNKKIQSFWGILFCVLFSVCGVVSFRGGEVYSYSFSYIRHNETAFMALPALLMVLFLSKYKIAKFYGSILLVLMLYGVGYDIKSQKFQSLVTESLKLKWNKNKFKNPAIDI